MKKFSAFLLCLCLLSALLPTRAAALVEVARYDEATRTYTHERVERVTLQLDGVALEADTPAMLVRGRTLVPVRLLAESLGAEVTWDAARRQAAFSTAETTVVLTLGSAVALVNGEPVDLPGGVPAYAVVHRGYTRTMAPLRFVAQHLGAGVGWDADARTARISSPGNSYPYTTPKNPGRYTIAIDPGHGGSASGAWYSGVAEKDINLAVALLLREELTALGYQVVMTRSDDRDVGLTRRCTIANQAGADIFLSLHSNASATNLTFQGIYTYYHPTSSRGRALAQAIQNPVCEVTGGIDRGILGENFVVVRETRMPAALVEMGFMSTPEELSRLVDPVYQRKLAQGIAEGAVRYLNSL